MHYVIPLAVTCGVIVAVNLTERFVHSKHAAKATAHTGHAAIVVSVVQDPTTLEVVKTYVIHLLVQTFTH
jgi:hypothetical protein